MPWQFISRFNYGLLYLQNLCRFAGEGSRSSWKSTLSQDICFPSNNNHDYQHLFGAVRGEQVPPLHPSICLQGIIPGSFPAHFPTQLESIYQSFWAPGLGGGISEDVKNPVFIFLHPSSLVLPFHPSFISDFVFIFIMQIRDTFSAHIFCIIACRFIYTLFLRQIFVHLLTKIYFSLVCIYAHILALCIFKKQMHKFVCISFLCYIL